MLDNKRKELISHQVIRTLKSRFDSFPEDSSNNRNAPFHEAFLNAFKPKFKGKIDDISYFVSLSSWLHGLNTTLGQSFFENVAHILSGGKKIEFTKKKKTSLEITEHQSKQISSIMTDLKNGINKPSVVDENRLILNFKKSKNIPCMDFTADNYIETDKYIEAIELKSVRPNSGEMRGEKQKILFAKAALKKKYPNKEIRFFIGFPFDSTADSATSMDKSRFIKSNIELKKFWGPDEVLLGPELWDRLSGDNNTMEQMLEIINRIAKPDFIKKFNYINNPKNAF